MNINSKYTQMGFKKERKKGFQKQEYELFLFLII